MYNIGRRSGAAVLTACSVRLNTVRTEGCRFLSQVLILRRIGTQSNKQQSHNTEATKPRKLSVVRACGIMRARGRTFDWWRTHWCSLFAGSKSVSSCNSASDAFMSAVWRLRSRRNVSCLVAPESTVPLLNIVDESLWHVVVELNQESVLILDRFSWRRMHSSTRDVYSTRTHSHYVLHAVRAEGPFVKVRESSVDGRPFVPLCTSVRLLRVNEQIPREVVQLVRSELIFLSTRLISETECRSCSTGSTLRSTHWASTTKKRGLLFFHVATLTYTQKLPLVCPFSLEQPAVLPDYVCGLRIRHNDKKWDEKDASGEIHKDAEAFNANLVSAAGTCGWCVTPTPTNTDVSSALARLFLSFNPRAGERSSCFLIPSVTWHFVVPLCVLVASYFSGSVRFRTRALWYSHYFTVQIWPEAVCTCISLARALKRFSALVVKVLKARKYCHHTPYRVVLCTVSSVRHCLDYPPGPSGRHEPQRKVFHFFSLPPQGDILPHLVSVYVYFLAILG